MYTHRRKKTVLTEVKNGVKDQDRQVVVISSETAHDDWQYIKTKKNCRSSNPSGQSSDHAQVSANASDTKPIVDASKQNRYALLSNDQLISNDENQHTTSEVHSGGSLNAKLTSLFDEVYGSSSSKRGTASAASTSAASGSAASGSAASACLPSAVVASASRASASTVSASVAAASVATASVASAIVASASVATDSVEKDESSSTIDTFQHDGENNFDKLDLNSDSSSETESETESESESDNDSDFLALKSNQDHIPGRFSSHMFDVNMHMEYLRKAEVKNRDGSVSLRRIVRWLLDPTLLFFYNLRQESYDGNKRKEMKQRYDLNDITAYNIEQLQRQAFLNHHLYHKGAYSAQELEDMVEPFTGGVQGMMTLFSVVTKSKFGSLQMQKMTPSQVARHFVKYCIDTDVDTLRSEANSTSGPDVDGFIARVESWTPASGDATPFVKTAKRVSLPRVPYLANETNERKAVTYKNRDRYQMTSMQVFDNYTVGQRDRFRNELLKRDEEEERAALLYTYGKLRLNHILAAFMRVLIDGIHHYLCARFDTKTVISVLLQILTLPADVKLLTLKAESFFDPPDWKWIQDIRDEWIKSLNKLDITRVVSASNSTNKRARDIIQYFFHKARGCLHRFYKTMIVDAQEVKELGAILYHLFESGGRLCLFCKAKLIAGEGYGWDSPSVDRIVSGKKGGKYVEDNIQMICNGCNYVKSYHSQDEALLILYKLASTSFTLDKNGMFNTPNLDVKPIATIEENAYVDKWVEQRLTSCRNRALHKGGNGKVKAFNVTKKDYRKEVESCYIGNGWVQDATGFRGPLSLFCFDRMDSNDGYVEGNVRILHSGTNWVRSDSTDDKETARFLNHLKTQKHRLKKMFKKGTRLPLAKTTADLLNNITGSLDELEEAEACMQDDINRFEAMMVEEEDEEEIVPKASTSKI